MQAPIERVGYEKISFLKAPSPRIPQAEAAVMLSPSVQGWHCAILLKLTPSIIKMLYHLDILEFPSQ
jgi:hypothetical protein